jgi:class 3 adenylate cyclase/predicted ATPase/energy-coupling factor transporter ATP-binding protein EcfA2
MAGDLRQWLGTLGFEQLADKFVENRIELSHLPDLTEDDLRELGVTAMGDRKSLMRAIAARSETASEVDAPGHASPPERQSVSGERRQLTVLFCDLVGFTELSQQLDPEDLGELIHRYQDAVSGAVARYGGHVAKFLGDGVLAYFGWPHAYEDQAERAVRAGIDAISAVKGISLGGKAKLQSRVGIATGPVVVGDLIGKSALDTEAVIGETPNLSARLQDAAEPNQIIIDQGTHRLIGRTFQLLELGPLNLKGFNAGVPAWQVTGRAAPESRFEAARSGPLTGLVGRKHELGLLRERWDLAKGREGQIVLLSGEAGIGKSRLVRALRDAISHEEHFRLRYQCSPHHVNSAFYPIIQRLERAAKFSPDDTATSKLDKLKSLLQMSGPDISQALPLFANLLAVPLDERYDESELTPQQRRDKTIDAMINQVIALSQRRPVLFVLEDAHWIDPTTEGLLGQTMARISTAAILMVVTHRPEYTPSWNVQPHLTSITLSRLGREQVSSLIKAISGRGLDRQIVKDIIARTDGVPLYVEELTKLVLASGEHAGGNAAQIEVPMTLQSSLIARLDQLGDAKEIAQIGAVIGRSFSYELLREVADASDEQLGKALDRIIGSELAFRQGIHPEATYTFKHALVQDTAYSTLLRNRRSTLHARTAKILEDHFAKTAETHPEVLAYHYTEAGLAANAIPFWQQAGRLAAERSAVPEAVAHLQKGLDLLETLPESDEREAMELSLKVLLGPALISAKGFASEDAQRVLARARELCEQRGDAENLFPVLFGLWIGNNSRGAVSTAKTIAGALMRSTESSDNNDHRLQAYHCHWTSEFFSGNPASCYEHTGLGEHIYDPSAHRMHKFLYGAHDPGVCARQFRCMSAWLLGHADRAVKHANDAIALGEKLGHARSFAMALYFTAVIHYFRGEPDIAAERAERAIAICTENAIPASGTRTLRDRALIELGDKGRLDADIAETMAALRSGGTTVMWPWFLALHAETDASFGRASAGLEKVQEALAYAERTGERWIDGDLYRLKGELLLAESVANKGPAEAAFKAAIDIAQKQSAKAIALRAATRLARVWAEDGKLESAHDLLLPILDQFSEGIDTRDLVEANVLLSELQ